MKTFIINGYGGSGKDTFVHYVADYLSKRGKALKNLSYATPAKEIARKSVAWDESDKSEKARRMLAELTRVLEEFDDIPMSYLRLQHVTNSSCTDTEVEFMHIREPKQIGRAKEFFNATTVFVVNNKIEKVTSNYADAGVENYHYDRYVVNDGSLCELESLAEWFCEQEILK